MTLQQINNLDNTHLKEVLTRCCGAAKWVERMSSLFPFGNEESLFEQVSVIWSACDQEDWREAFSHHPRIGDINSLKEKFATTSDWAAAEQSGVKQSPLQTLEDLSEANKYYEEKFGFIFIVCATGKSAEEMLELLKKRLGNKPEVEIRIAMEEQNKITILRVEKLLQS